MGLFSDGFISQKIAPILDYTQKVSLTIKIGPTFCIQSKSNLLGGQKNKKSGPENNFDLSDNSKYPTSTYPKLTETSDRCLFRENVGPIF